MAAIIIILVLSYILNISQACQATQGISNLENPAIINNHTGLLLNSTFEYQTQIMLAHVQKIETITILYSILSLLFFILFILFSTQTHTMKPAVTKA